MPKRRKKRILDFGLNATLPVAFFKNDYEYPVKHEIRRFNVPILAYCYEGMGLCYCNHSFINFTKGSLILIPENIPFAIQSPEGAGCRFKFLACNLEAMDLEFPHNLKNYEFLRSDIISIADTLFTESERIMNETETPSVCEYAEVKPLSEENTSTLCHLLNTLAIKFFASETHFTTPPRPKKVKRLEPAFYEIINNFSNELSVEFLAEKCGLSVTYYRKATNEITGLSPLNLLFDIRLNLAGNMLKNTKIKINKIAAACGFQSISTFNRNFTRLSGMSPKMYRKIQ